MQHNRRLLIVSLITFIIAFAIVAGLVYLLLQDNEKYKQLAAQATADKVEAEKTLNTLRQNGQAFVSDDITPCVKYTVNLGLSSYVMPCNWQSYIDIKYASQPVTVGFLSDKPITLTNGQSDGLTKVKVELTRYSSVFGNYVADPITAIMTSFIASKNPVTSAVNKQSTLVYQVSGITTVLGEVTRHYSQRVYNGDVYLIMFEYYLKDAEVSKTIIDTFSWSV